MKHGGILQLAPRVQVNGFLRKGQLIGSIVDIFGVPIAEYAAPNDCVIVGRNIDPVVQSGDRLVHVGNVGDYYAEAQNDGHAA